MELDFDRTDIGKTMAAQVIRAFAREAHAANAKTIKVHVRTDQARMLNIVTCTWEGHQNAPRPFETYVQLVADALAPHIPVHVISWRDLYGNNNNNNNQDDIRGRVINSVIVRKIGGH